MRPRDHPLILRSFDDSQLPELMSWFADRRSCQVWGGPAFRFPFSAASFREDARLGYQPTWTLTDQGRALLGCGQYYLRVGRCHLARLAIAPTCRGRGYGSTLIHLLCRTAAAELGVDSFSLFVDSGNDGALRLYRRLGFSQQPYPESSPGLAGCVYMVSADMPDVAHH